MINTIRLFRRKEDDLPIIYVLEFLKLIGFMVSDCVIRDYGPIEESWFRNIYDVNIVYGNFNSKSDSDEIRMKFRDLEVRVKEKNNIFMHINHPKSQEPKKVGRFILRKLIQRMWETEEAKNEMLFLLREYAKSNIFLYLYHKGNLKFIQEYYPIRRSPDGSTKEQVLRKNICSQTLIKFSKFYSRIIKYNLETEPETVNFCFARLSMEYELNDIKMLMKRGRVFSTDSMLERIDCIKKKAPNMIRLYYLGGNICSLDNLYLANADSFYMAAITKTKRRKELSEMLGFLYYQLGAYYERKYQNAEVALEAYGLAYNNDKNLMRALYKLAQNDFDNGDYEKTIRNANKIIRFLLNGNPMRDAMPGQQLYAYKSFVLMGDAYYEMGDYDLSEKCYQRALEISDKVSKFYDEYDPEGIFRSIQKMCMPTQQLYFKLINCASEYRNMDQAARYYENFRKQM